MLNYSTKVSCEKTISEIQKILVSHGAHKITTDYLNNSPSAVTFCLTLNGRLVAFSLPANHKGVMRVLQNDPKARARLGKQISEDQAQRVAWRIVKDWVEAQMAIVEAELAEMAEVFLPYAITKNGNTLYKEVQEKGILMLQ
jgi:hypothetical protein